MKTTLDNIVAATRKAKVVALAGQDATEHLKVARAMFETGNTNRALQHLAQAHAALAGLRRTQLAAIRNIKEAAATAE